MSKCHEVMNFCRDTPHMPLMGAKYNFVMSGCFEATFSIKGVGFCLSKGDLNLSTTVHSDAL